MIKKQYRLTATFKDYLWGGTLLKEKYNKQTNLLHIAESWELSCHKDGVSHIDSQLTLPELITITKSEVLGTNCSHFDRFPVLCKMIDAADNLSVQVHPTDDYALKIEGEYGKNELWYVADCIPEAEIIYGMTDPCTRTQFLTYIQNGTLLNHVNKVPVHKGDAFFIPAGTLHAIGKGCLIVEVQQNSNVSYRIYDYDRTDTNGKPRSLHIEKAAEVTLLQPFPITTISSVKPFNGGTIRQLGICAYFDVSCCTLYTSESSYYFVVGSKSFLHILIIDGSALLNQEEAPIGSSFFIPANAGECCLSGKCTAIITTIP